MCEVSVGSSAELEKMIELVFEKAINDTNFANLYAEMCVTLESRSKSWAFLQFVHSRDDQSYFWIRDLSFDNMLAGPYHAPEQCIDATLGGLLLTHHLRLTNYLRIVHLLLSFTPFRQYSPSYHTPEQCIDATLGGLLSLITYPNPAYLAIF